MFALKRFSLLGGPVPLGGRDSIRVRTYLCICIIYIYTCMCAYIYICLYVRICEYTDVYYTYTRYYHDSKVVVSCHAGVVINSNSITMERDPFQGLLWCRDLGQLQVHCGGFYLRLLVLRLCCLELPLGFTFRRTQTLKDVHQLPSGR